MASYPHHPFRSRLDAAAARSIRARVRGGEAPRDLATEYSVAIASVYDVLAGRSYRPRLVVDVTDDLIESLTAAAAAQGQSVNIFVIRALRRAISVS
jgi:hypothetical protein